MPNKKDTIDKIEIRKWSPIQEPFDYHKTMVKGAWEDPDPLHEYYNKIKPEDIEKVIFHDPATIVIWKNGSKTVVKCGKDDEYIPEVGLAMCIVKKFFGSRSAFKKCVREWLDE